MKIYLEANGMRLSVEVDGDALTAYQFHGMCRILANAIGYKESSVMDAFGDFDPAEIIVTNV